MSLTTSPMAFALYLLSPAAAVVSSMGQSGSIRKSIRSIHFESFGQLIIANICNLLPPLVWKWCSWFCNKLKLNALFLQKAKRKKVKLTQESQEETAKTKSYQRRFSIGSYWFIYVHCQPREWFNKHFMFFVFSDSLWISSCGVIA